MRLVPGKRDRLVVAADAATAAAADTVVVAKVVAREEVIKALANSRSTGELGRAGFEPAKA
jgi:hypothetical protein